jgi:histone H3/H4
MVKRKVDKEEEQEKKVPSPVPAKKAAKKAKGKSQQERAGLHISPGRCRRIVGNLWNGGKLSKEAPVVMAALLQHFAENAIRRAVALAGEDGQVTCSELQRAITSMGWPRQSGLLKVHIIGAAIGQEPDAEEPEVASE